MNEQQQVNQELDLLELKEQYERQKPKLSEVELFNIFPEAKKKWGKTFLTRMKIRKMRLQLYKELVEWETIYRLRTNSKDNQWADGLIKDSGKTKIDKIDKELRAIEGQVDFFKRIGKKHILGVQKMVITASMVARAKEYPIEKLIEINKQGFTKCYKHNDTHASAYTKNNFLHCFSCSYSADTIQVLVDRDGLTFKQAVLQLQ